MSTTEAKPEGAATVTKLRTRAQLRTDAFAEAARVIRTRAKVHTRVYEDMKVEGRLDTANAAAKLAEEALKCAELIERWAATETKGPAATCPK